MDLATKAVMKTVLLDQLIKGKILNKSFPWLYKMDSDQYYLAYDHRNIEIEEKYGTDRKWLIERKVHKVLLETASLAKFPLKTLNTSHSHTFPIN